MVSLAAVFCVLSVVLAVGALPVPRESYVVRTGFHRCQTHLSIIARSSERDVVAGQTFSFIRGYVPEVQNVARRSVVWASGSDQGPERNDVYSSAGEGRTRTTSGGLAKKAVVAFLLWLAVAVLLALGVGVALYVARSRVSEASREMLEMLPRVEKAVDAGAGTGALLEDEDGDPPSPDVLPPREEEGTGSADNDDDDLIVLSDTDDDDDATEDLIYFGGDEGKDGEPPVDDGQPRSIDSSDEDAAESPEDDIPLLPPLDLAIVAPPSEETAAVADDGLFLPHAPTNPWGVPASAASESPEAPALLLPVAGSQEETPFATPMSSPVASPRRAALTRLLDAETDASVTGRRRWTPLDLALVMQLRPGFGAGAELAWMVQLLMGVWAWIGVLVLR